MSTILSAHGNMIANNGHINRSLIRNGLFGIHPARGGRGLHGPNSTKPGYYPTYKASCTNHDTGFQRSPVHDFQANFTQDSRLITARLFRLLRTDNSTTGTIMFSSDQRSTSGTTLSVRHQRRRSDQQRVLIDTLHRVSTGPHSAMSSLSLRVTRTVTGFSTDTIMHLVKHGSTLRNRNSMSEVHLTSIVRAPSKGKGILDPLLTRVIDLKVRPMSSINVRGVPTRPRANKGRFR